MSRRVPLNVRFRPQPIATAEVERSSQAADELLAEPASWLRRLHAARIDVSLFAPQSPSGPLGAVGFAPLCTAWVRHPAPGGRVERVVDVWIDPTATIRADVVGQRVYLSTLFDDGTSLVLFPDPVVASWIASPRCAVLGSSGELRTDIERFETRVAQRVTQGGTPLVCANGELYRQQLNLAARHAKLPTVGVCDGQLIYPMTLLLAAEIVAARESVADARGLPG